MKRRIKWYNIIPKPIQRLQAKFFTLRDRYIETDYEYDKNKKLEKLEQQEQYNQQTNPSKTVSYILVGFIILIVWLFILPTLLI